MAAVQTREPEIFAIGDALLFEKCLPAYPLADGWSMEYVLTDAAGAKKATVNSTASNGCHRIYDADFAADMEPGDYVLSGFVTDGTDRHQVYYSTLSLAPDLVAVTAAGSVLTEAQEFIVILRASLKDLYKQQFQETDVQKSRFVMQKQTEVRQELAYWKEIRVNEIQCQRARNGQPTGATARVVFAIG